MRSRTVLTALFALFTLLLSGGRSQAAPARPAFDCSQATGEVQKRICADSALAALDVKLDRTWRTVLARSTANADLRSIRAEQRGWVKGRDDCWKADDVRACTESSYRMRISELQARWRLVPMSGPFFYACDGNPSNEVVVTLFESDLPIAMIERGDRTSVAYLDTTSAEQRYVGRNETLVMKGDVAHVSWGDEAPTMVCRPRSTSPH